MARPKKVGLEYFPLDCQMDDKILMLEAEHGMEGFGIYIRLLQFCYQQEDGKLDMSLVFRWKTLGKTLGILPDNLRTMVNTMLEVGLFDANAYANEQKLTSNGIQKRLGKIDHMRQKDRLRKAEADSDESKTLSDGKQENSGRKSAQKESNTNVLLKGKNNKNILTQTLNAFTQFWDGYDKKVDRKKCWEKWQKLSESDHQAILSNVAAYVKKYPDPQHRKNPLTYLNGENWKDPLVSSTQTVVAGQGKEMVY